MIESNQWGPSFKTSDLCPIRLKRRCHIVETCHYSKLLRRLLAHRPIVRYRVDLLVPAASATPGCVTISEHPEEDTR